MVAMEYTLRTVLQVSPALYDSNDQPGYEVDDRDDQDITASPLTILVAPSMAP